MSIDRLIAEMQEKYDFDIRVTSKGEHDGSSLINAEIALTPKPVAATTSTVACYEAMKKVFADACAPMIEEFNQRIRQAARQ